MEYIIMFNNFSKICDIIFIITNIIDEKKCMNVLNIVNKFYALLPYIT